MPKRLAELYQLQEPVEILLRNAGSRWVAGRVVAYDFPGVWVETANGSRWFVTNRRRIRHRRPQG